MHDLLRKMLEVAPFVDREVSNEEIADELGEIPDYEPVDE